MLNDDEVFGGFSNAPEMLQAARHSWDEALELGSKHGYRNAQTTVIAPTGTIGLLMDCDTTGVEPDFSLVKFKKLAGGGYFKIANQSLAPALSSLGYDEKEVKDILTYVMGAQSLEVLMPDAKGNIGQAEQTFAMYLSEKGLTNEELEKLSEGLAGAMELGFIFNAFTIGEEAVERLGLQDEADLLKAFGLTKHQINKLNDLICGTGTIEGAPHIADEHLPVFDCANKCGKYGQRFIAPKGHIFMMSAVQPFISGAISKTINMPNEASVEDIKDAYRTSWELGLKANALYRDGCKLSQPLNATTDTDDGIEDEEGIEAAQLEVADEVVAAAGKASRQEPVEKIVERIVERPMRRRLMDTRQSITHKFNVAGHEGYLTVGLYDEGNPGELFITMAKEGSTIGGLMDSLGTAISVALQYGVPIESLVNKFSHQRFEPSGATHNREIPFAKSLVDYIFRWMGMQFVAGYRAANAPQRPTPKPKAKATPVVKEPVEVKTETATDRRIKSSAIEETDKSDNGHKNRLKDDDAKPTGGTRIAIDDPNIIDQHQAKHNPLDKISATNTAAIAVADKQNAQASVVVDSLSEANSKMMGDAPACDVCGSITIRNGTCYKCMNCGNSMGCS